MVNTFGMSDQQIEQVWDLRGEGYSFRKISRVVNRLDYEIRRYVSASGGVRPRPKKRPKRHLCLADREEISRGLARGDSYRWIGERNWIP